MKGSSRSLFGVVAYSLVLGFFTVGTIESGAGRNTSDGSARSSTFESARVPGDVARGTKAVKDGNGPNDGAVLTVPPKGVECASGKNGARTAIGVSATKIRLAATIVTDGPAADLLKWSPTGMRAVVDKVNSQGGICGRIIELVLRNDSFDQQRGQQYIRTWATDEKEDIFALAVVPSAEGLGAAISNGDISRSRIPVVGTDGMRKEQYEDPWVWPVATATVSTMRIMARFGKAKKDARTFAIVYDSKYKFGREGAESFVTQVKRDGGKLVTSVGLDPAASSYATEANEFNNACDGKCDMVAMLLLPDTAKKWMSRQPVKGLKYTAGAQTLFTKDFARACTETAGAACHGLAVWTGYNPPLGRYAALPDVAQYVDDVRAVAPNADVDNQFLEGSYLGMKLMVEALRRVGAQLTRDRLRTVLDSMKYSNDITAGLEWHPLKHHANVRARSFSMVVSGSSFLDWRDEQTGWVLDPAFGG